jgi:hypothetical protein
LALHAGDFTKRKAFFLSEASAEQEDPEKEARPKKPKKIVKSASENGLNYVTPIPYHAENDTSYTFNGDAPTCADRHQIFESTQDGLLRVREVQFSDEEWSHYNADSSALLKAIKPSQALMLRSHMPSDKPLFSSLTYQWKDPECNREHGIPVSLSINTLWLLSTLLGRSKVEAVSCTHENAKKGQANSLLYLAPSVTWPTFARTLKNAALAVCTAAEKRSEKRFGDRGELIVRLNAIVSRQKAYMPILDEIINDATGQKVLMFTALR